MSESIDVLKNLGSDAFSNLYNIILPVVPGVAGLDGLEVRMTSFPIPADPKPTVYKVNYKTGALQKTGPGFEYEFELTIPLRVDKQYQAYKYFLTWKKLGYDSVSGISEEDVIPAIPVVVQGVDQSNNIYATWVFEDFKPISIGGFNFDQTSNTDPLSVDIICQYSSFNSAII